MIKKILRGAAPGGRSSTGESPPPKKRRDIKPAVSGWTSTDDYYADSVGIPTRVYLDGSKRPFYFDTHDREWRQRPQSQEEEGVSGVFLPGSTTQVTLSNGKKLWEFKKLDFHGKPVEHYFFYNGDEDERFKVVFSEEEGQWIRTDGQPIPMKGAGAPNPKAKLRIPTKDILGVCLIIFWVVVGNLIVAYLMPQSASWGPVINWLPGAFSPAALARKVSVCQANYLLVYLSWSMFLLGFFSTLSWFGSQAVSGFQSRVLFSLSVIFMLGTIGLTINRLGFIKQKIDFLIPFFQLLGWEC